MCELFLGCPRRVCVPLLTPGWHLPRLLGILPWDCTTSMCEAPWGAVGFMGEHFWDANLGLCVAQVLGAVWTGGSQGRNSL